MYWIMQSRYALDRVSVMVCIQTSEMAEMSNMVWSSISCSLTALRAVWCIEPSPHMLIRAKGMYIVVMFRHSSAFRMPAAASP